MALAPCFDLHKMDIGPAAGWVVVLHEHGVGVRAAPAVLGEKRPGLTCGARVPFARRVTCLLYTSPSPRDRG